MYTKFYRLSKKPFQLTPDPEFFFNSPVHKRALAYLRYGLAQGEGFIVVTGMPGTGKTMLVKELFQSLRRENIVAGLMVTSQVGAEDTLRIISATFGLSYDGDDKATLLRNLESFFKEKAREGRRVLLVVDEAQNLPLQSLEELRMLSNFEVNGRPLFQAFLLGQDEFRNVLQSDALTQVRQRVIATYHLRPLTLEETRDYVLHRLELAGWRQDPRFEAEAFDPIHRYSKGVPRIINTLCDRLLLFSYLEELHRIDAEVVENVVQELREEALEAGKTETSGEEAVSPVFASSPRPDKSVSVVSAPLLDRIEKLERTVAELQRIVEHERALLRKAILLQLDMDSAYSSGETMTPPTRSAEKRETARPESDEAQSAGEEQA